MGTLTIQISRRRIHLAAGWRYVAWVCAREAWPAGNGTTAEKLGYAPDGYHTRADGMAAITAAGHTICTCPGHEEDLG